MNDGPFPLIGAHERAGLRDPLRSSNGLPARSAVGALAWASVSAAARAAAVLRDDGGGVPELDPRRIADAYTSERLITIDAIHPNIWAPLSGFFRASDGWVRTHGNYPHHAAALLRAVGLPADDVGVLCVDRENVAAKIAGMSAAQVSHSVTGAGGICVVTTPEDPFRDAALRKHPLLRVEQLGSAAPRSKWEIPDATPLAGIRVLDLTRVIAGPVATRTLALLGADVLRIDPPHLPEPEWQHLDTGHGKRTTLLDLRRPRGRARLDALIADADVVVTGYRPAAMTSLGLDPRALASCRPGLVIGRLSAWGADSSNADRRGFDSIVQAASGLSWVESPDGVTPGALPAQALDHSAGYLLAAGVMTMLHRQRTDGGTWLVETSLRRIAAELLGMPRGPLLVEADHTDTAAQTVSFEVDGHTVVTAGPAFGDAGGFRPPRPLGRDRARWAPREGREAE